MSSVVVCMKAYLCPVISLSVAVAVAVAVAVEVAVEMLTLCALYCLFDVISLSY